MAKQLEGTVAVITGADSGIGSEIAKVFAANGASVAIDYLNDETGARATRDAIHRAGGRAHIVQADVGDEAAVERLFATAERDSRQQRRKKRLRRSGARHEP